MFNTRGPTMVQFENIKLHKIGGSRMFALPPEWYKIFGKGADTVNVEITNEHKLLISIE